MDVGDHSNNHQTKLKFIFFLKFLGFPGKEKRLSNTAPKAHNHNRRFRRSTFFKQSRTRTFPVDSNLSEKIQPRKSFSFKKSRPKHKADEIALKPQSPATNSPKLTPQYQLQETRASFEKNFILEGKLLEDMTDPRPKNEAFRRQIDAIRNGSSPARSLGTKTKSNLTMIARSTSFPISAPINSAEETSTEKSRVSARKPLKESETISNQFDPVIGMSIIMITLIIMLLWGRLCAILCTCSWLCFVSRLRNNGVDLNPDHSLKTGLSLREPDFNSEVYKKKVVLEGFLERNRKRSIS